MLSRPRNSEWGYGPFLSLSLGLLLGLIMYCFGLQLPFLDWFNAYQASHHNFVHYSKITITNINEVTEGFGIEIIIFCLNFNEIDCIIGYSFFFFKIWGLTCMSFSNENYNFCSSFMKKEKEKRKKKTRK